MVVVGKELSVNELVSVVAVAYNSEKYIIDTLESVKRQTYKNIELIITDDASTDSTVKLAEKWIEDNGDIFNNVQLIKSNENEGITVNTNRGLKYVKGKYVILLACDDIILDRGIEYFVEFMMGNSLQIAFSRVELFTDKLNTLDLQNIIEMDKNIYNVFFAFSKKEQYKALLKGKMPFSLQVGCMYDADLFRTVGFLDEQYKMVEDYPYLVKLSKLGYEFKLLNKYTIKYRVNKLANTNSDKRFKLEYENLRDFRKNEVIPAMKKEKMYFQFIRLKLVMLILDLQGKTDNKFIHAIVIILRRISFFFRRYK